MRVRVRRLGLRVLSSLLLGALVLEVGARVLLFSSMADELSLAQDLRRPERLAHPAEDLYWVLQSAFQAGKLAQVPGYHAAVGWTGGSVTPGANPGEWSHADDASLGQRRPVLLYGDSYAACASPRGTCFQDYLERGELGATHRILNHGVGGYGLDQAALLLEQTVDGYREKDPVVVIGVLVDDDLDRCALRFRGWPKPRFERARGGWVAREASSEHPRPPLVAGYGLRLLLHGGALASSSVHAALCPVGRVERVNRERCRALIERAVAELQGRDLEAFFVFFFGSQAIERPERTGWREPFLREVLDGLGMPWVSTRGPLLANAKAAGRSLEPYYLPNGHLSPLGNEVALRAITEGLAGRFGDAADTSWSDAQLAGALSADRIAEVVLGGPNSAARYEYGFRPPFGRAEADRSRLCFRVTGDAATELRYDLGGRARSFEATAWFIPVGQLGPGEGSVGLALIADGVVLERTRLVRGDEPHAIRVELAGRETFTIAVDTAGDGARGDWLVLSSPVFD